jgi:hypothetical protein
MICQLFLLFWVIQGTHLGLGLGLPEDNPPTGLLTKTQPNPRVGFWWAGLGGGRVLARPMGNEWRFSNEIFYFIEIDKGMCIENFQVGYH